MKVVVMKLYWIGRTLCATLLLPTVLGCFAHSQSMTLVGVYSSDGKYHTPSKMRFLYNKQSAVDDNRDARPSEVPTWVNLHPSEETVQNYRPPIHAVRKAKPPSGWATLRDNIITFAYGHERMLVSPQRVITDSANRLIVADPAGSAVHVLSETGSFRILCGPQRRVQKPSGIAIDGDDNIYISDSVQGVIAVYDPNGSFVRYIGRLDKDENLFHYPTGIAIDRRTRTLYVLDSERHLLFLLDLNGKVIKRVGRFSGNDTVVDFEYPTDIAVGDHELAILDAGATRVWITDLEGNPVHHFSFAIHDHPQMVERPGIAVDRGGHIYLRHPVDGSIRVYGRDGQLLTSFAHPADRTTNFSVPAGLYIDSQDRFYVADEYTRNVQVFQLMVPGAPLMMAAGE